MSETHFVRFSDFELDLKSEELRRSGTLVKLQPQPLKVLTLLALRAGDLVRREEIRVEIWGNDTFVDFEQNLNFCIRRIRQALGDDAEKPRYVETLARRGYRFIAPMQIADKTEPASLFGTGSPSHRRITVGQEAERAKLHTCFRAVCSGRGMIAFVSGEQGIGKTTLVENFLDLIDGSRVTLARGYCSQQLTGSEASLPFLEALDSVTRGNDQDELSSLLKKVAPAWYVHAAASNPDLERMRARLGGAIHERMKREIAQFLREAARLHPVIVFLDDLHWADASTLDILAYLGARLSSMRVLIIATHRPVNPHAAGHPLPKIRLELQARGCCAEIPLAFLKEGDIRQYLGAAYPDNRFPDAFAALVHQRTEGNPFFMTHLFQSLQDQGVILKDDDSGLWVLSQEVEELDLGLPEAVRNLIHDRIRQLSNEEQHILVTASVQGCEFDSAIVGTVTQLDPMVVEERLEVLDRAYGLVRLVRDWELPDRTFSRRYQFVHVFYQNVLYESLKPTRRAHLRAKVVDALAAHLGQRKLKANQKRNQYLTERRPLVEKLKFARSLD